MNEQDTILRAVSALQAQLELERASRRWDFVPAWIYFPWKPVEVNPASVLFAHTVTGKTRLVTMPEAA